MSSIQKFEIDLSAVGERRVVVNGVDLSDQVSRVTVDTQALAVPIVYLEGHGIGTITGEGVVIERVDDRESVVAFLEAVDPDRLEKVALEGAGLEGTAAGPTEAMLETLKRWARGDTN